MMKYIGIFLFVFLGCVVQYNNNKVSKNIDIKNTKLFTQNNTENKLIVDSAAAVFYTPKDIQLEELKKKLGDSYTEVINDNHYYSSKALMILDSIKINVIITKNYEIIFKGQHGVEFIINRLNLENKYWGLIFFNGTDSPEVVSLTEMSEKLSIFNCNNIEL
ncbi:MAG: hypothetical protein JEY96_00770 [Bacteroidales bacterium]|nr:hypothetical protein [Bacteroidales bacterium]